MHADNIIRIVPNTMYLFKSKCLMNILLVLVSLSSFEDVRVLECDRENFFETNFDKLIE